MFKKVNRNFRRRQNSDADDDDDSTRVPDVPKVGGGPVVIRTAVEPVGVAGTTAVRLMDQKLFLPPNLLVKKEKEEEEESAVSAFEMAQRVKTQQQKDKKTKTKKKKDETSAAVTVAAATTTTGKDAPPSSLLSFDDLEEGDVDQPFKIKKSKESRRLERELKKEKKLEKARKKLEESDSSSANVKQEDDADSDEAATYIDAGDIRIKVKSFNVPTSVATIQQQQQPTDVKPVVFSRVKEEEEEGKAFEDIDDGDDEDEENEIEEEKPPTTSGRNERFGAARRQAEGPGLQRMLEQGKIPDAALIHAVRKRRQQLAQEGPSGGGSPAGGAAGEDYVPLKSNSVPPPSSSSARKPGMSRLVTEEQEYDEDMTQPLKFSVNQEAVQRQEYRDNFMAAEHGGDAGSDDNDNEALQRWEREQIKKGFTGAANGAGSGSISPTGADSLVGTYYGLGEGGGDPVNSVVAAAAAASMSSSSNGGVDNLTSKKASFKCDSIGDVKKRIKSRVDAFEDVRRAHRNELDSLEDSLALTEHSIHTHETDVKGLEKKYAFFQEMRCFATDLVDCLNDKLPKIEALEASVHALWRKRAEKLEKRYQTDVKDMAAQFSANASKNFDTDTRKRILEREGRRMRRKQARASITAPHEDGLSTDDEENVSEIETFRAERLRLVQSASEVWTDVVEDFYKLDSIQKRFEEWKKSQGDSYQNAFIAFCLPALFAPFVRLHMIGWSPFGASSSSKSRLDDALATLGQEESIENFEWFQTLLMYNSNMDHLTTTTTESADLPNGDDRESANFVNGKDDDGDTDDDDFRILPRVVEKVVVPKLNFFVEDVWNPLSSTQTKLVSNLLHHLVDEYPTVHMDSKNVLTLVKSVVARLKRTLNEDIYMPLYSKDAISDCESDTYLFFHRQLTSCVKLFGNMFEFSSLLGVAQLQDMAFDSLLNRYIMIGLLTMGMSKEGLLKCRAIVERIPEKWMRKVTKMSHESDGGNGGGGNNQATFPPLENFAKHVKNSSVAMGKEKQCEGESAFKEARELIKQAAHLLCDIYAYDHAKVLSELFSFKI